MKKITIEVPEGKKAVQDWTELESFEEFYEAADTDARKEYDADCCVSVDGIAYNKLRLITMVTNTDRSTGKRWVPDWDNTNQKKWCNYFVLSSGSGFSLSLSFYLCDYLYTFVGSRLCFETQAQADGIRKKFCSLYLDYLTIKN